MPINFALRALRSVIVLSFLTVPFLHSHADKHLCEGFVPENEMRIPVGGTSAVRSRLADFMPSRALAGGLTEIQFNKVLDRINEIYAPLIAAKGKKLVINRRWTDPTVNASAQQYGRTWEINMYGGLARHAATTEEGFAIVACHEMGHHLGGAPKYGSMFGNWASNEGASDYFATLKCFRYFYEGADNQAWFQSVTHDPVALQKCQEQFQDSEEQIICLRGAAGALSVGFLFQDLRQETAPPKLDTPDPKQVRKTDDAHPATQCRTDTYFSGAICTAQRTGALSDTDYRAGSCLQGVDSDGWRPRCWFKP